MFVDLNALLVHSRFTRFRFQPKFDEQVIRLPPFISQQRPSIFSTCRIRPTMMLPKLRKRLRQKLDWRSLANGRMRGVGQIHQREILPRPAGNHRMSLLLRLCLPPERLLVDRQQTESRFAQHRNERVEPRLLSKPAQEPSNGASRRKETTVSLVMHYTWYSQKLRKKMMRRLGANVSWTSTLPRTNQPEMLLSSSLRPTSQLSKTGGMN